MILDDFQLNNRVALVTGGSRGLGLGMARGLAEAGASLALVARNATQLREAQKQLEPLGREVITIAADLSDVETAQQIVEEAVQKLGRLDILVANAGVNIRKPAAEITPQEFDQVMGINLRSVYFTCQSAAKHMRQHTSQDSHGKIITIASLSSVITLHNISVYTASKGAIMQLTKSLALEWASDWINVNAIGPGMFRTDLNDVLFENEAWVEKIHGRIPLGRTGMDRDLAGAAVFLASQSSNYITGQTLFVDGGWLIN